MRRSSHELPSTDPHDPPRPLMASERARHQASRIATPARAAATDADAAGLATAAAGHQGEFHQGRAAVDVIRRRLPHRRPCESFELEHCGLKYTVTFSHFDDGALAECFISNHKR